MNITRRIFAATQDVQAVLNDPDGSDLGSDRGHNAVEELLNVLKEYLDARLDYDHEALRLAIEARLPARVEVDVSEWVGCDEPDWGDPVYVTAEDPDEQVEYYDAICDLSAAPFADQVDYILEQLIQG